MIRILAGCVVNQVEDVFRAHLQTLQWQTGGFTVDLHFIVDVTAEGEKFNAMMRVLQEAGASWETSNSKPDGARYGVNAQTHDWSVPTFHWLAHEKQRLINKARVEGYDAIWITDSDLLCSPDTLSSLWNSKKDVVSAVFWTKWTPESPPLPQVWLSHPYELQGRGIEMHEFLGMLAHRKLVQVTGLGACTLIRAAVYDKVGYWPLVEGLPNQGMWQGEDRHFCVGAARNQVQLWADAYPDVWHCYRPEDRLRIPQVLQQMNFMLPLDPVHGSVRHCPGALGDDAACKCGRWYCRRFNPIETPQTGDLVSFTVEPLEEAQVAGYTHHERGRLGAIRMLPQIERELQNMRAGDERIVPVRFPLWWDIPEYRGQTKLVRLKLLHVKPFTEHPTLAEPAVHISEQFMEVA